MLADLTNKNPNVLYELGLAHAVGKPVVMVTQSIDDVPYDLRALRVIEYDVADPEWATSLMENIKKALAEVLDSPQQAVPPTFLQEKKTKRQPSVTPGERKILELQRDVDLLRMQLRSYPSGDVARISPRAAEALLREYREAGMPRRVILDRLSSMGAPRSWIADKLKIETESKETG